MGAPGEELVPSQRRLQRPPDFTGDRLDSFRDVFLRHGLPGLAIGLVALLHPGLRALLADSLRAFAADPVRYLAFGLAILLALVAYGCIIERRFDGKTVGWIVYLLLVSIWEEWVFRLAIPYFTAVQGVGLFAAVLSSNLLFGAMHYFTLRWKWPWCLAAFVGGLALSRQYLAHGDLALLIAIHWLVTFLNTPRLPGRGRRTEDDRTPAG